MKPHKALLLAALLALTPALPASAEGTITIGCPDHVNQVVWRLDRLDEESAAAEK